MLQSIRFNIILSAKREVKHRILLPFLLQIIDGKPLEQLLLSLEIALQSRYEQRLSKSSWTTQKVYIAILHQIINEASFIKIYISTLYDFFKVLYSYRIFHIAAILKSFGKVTKNNDTSKRISRKNNEIAKYHICGIADKEKK